MKRIIVFLTLLVLIFTIGKRLLPSNVMFDFHDETQPARISEFALNLKNGIIPPRMAPRFSFNLGYPVFNHYAPFSYWVSSAVNFVGFDIVDTVKLSFLLAIIVGLIFSLLFFQIFFDFFPSLLASVLYASSPWLAVEIFIRGNLAEVWFFALLPLALWIIYKNSQKYSPLIFFITSLVLSAILTVHNALSIVFIPLVIIYVLLLPNFKRNFLAFFMGFLLGAYFLIPGVIELGKTYASSRVNFQNYSGHLLCVWQLWTTPFWGYGGSIPGCNDGMSFMLGKPQLIIASVGLISLIYRLFNKKIKKKSIVIYLTLITFITLYLTTYLSLPISKILENLIGWFQFPWRLLIISLFGLSFLSAGLFVPKKLKKFSFVLIFIGFFILFYNSKFFIKDPILKNKFNQNFLSLGYIEKSVAYKISEYLPKTANYQSWLAYEPKKDGTERKDSTLTDGKFIHSLDGKDIKITKNTYFYKAANTNSSTVLINIHYFPYWQIFINHQRYIPEKFDSLGRPIINLELPSSIVVKYEQTTTEKIGNFITVTTFIGLILFFKLNNNGKHKKKNNR
jgi:hypothetical protein